jgi:Arc/MetJ family transcription regulator
MKEVVAMTSDTLGVRQNEDVPVTKIRNIRVDDALWREAQRIASERRETMTAILRRALVEYVEQYGGELER